MEQDIVVRVENVSKKYCLSIKKVMLYGAMDIMRDFLWFPYDSNILRKDEFWAVDDVSFSLRKGEAMGLIGPNGAGKSTLLKMINGIFMPDRGKIIVNGRVGALIEVGAGFHPMLTGRENIYVNASILGMKKKEIDKKFDEIVDFAGLGDFIDCPVKQYSSGMYIRLGFSIAVHSTPDILLVDEILAVGDQAFHYKCYEKVKTLRQNGVSIIFVSHSSNLIKRVCDKGILLNYGKNVFTGKVENALEEYDLIINKQIKKDLISLNREEQTEFRRGTGKARFTEVKILDIDGNVVEKVPFGTEKIRIYARYISKEYISKPYIWIILRDARKSDHILIVGGYSNSSINTIDFIEGEGEIECELDIQKLGPNLYGLYMGIADGEMESISYDIWDINGVFLEILKSEKLPFYEIEYPYLVSPFIFKHRRLN